MRASVLAVALGLVTTAGSAQAAEPVNANWPSYLPALPGPIRPQPHAVPYCRRETVACVDTEIRRMRLLQRKLRCDHRAVFTTTYLELTNVLRQTIRKKPR